MTRPPSASIWTGVLVAITTPFGPDGLTDPVQFVRHARWLAERGVDGIVVGGSLGEGGSLSAEERRSLVAFLAPVLPASVPVVAAVGAPSTAGVVQQAREAAAAGARGLLVLPPYLYFGDRREVHTHFSAVFRATELPCMLYNNPSAYGTDVTPEQVLELAAEHPTLTGVKESSGDIRRITALRALLGGRLDLAVGLDDAVLEGVRCGANAWVAGLANALPDESIALWDACRAGDPVRAFELYRWFLPLLRMDTGPKFVQRIKLATAERGYGDPRVRAPRLELTDGEREATLGILRDCLAHPPGSPRVP